MLNQVMKLQRERIRKEREAQAERLRREQEQAELDKLKEEEEKWVFFGVLGTGQKFGNVGSCWFSFK